MIMSIRRTRRSAAAALLLTAMSFAPAGAFAQTPADAKSEAVDPHTEEARDAFRIGSALAKQAQWIDALAAFERSAKLRPHAVTTYNIGFCERALGRFTRAKKSLTRALGAPGNELPADLAAEARGYLAEIDHRIARGVITLTKAGATVSVDGRPLEAAGGTPAHPVLIAGTREPGPAEPVAATAFDLTLDPGTHVIVVGVSGAPDTVVTRDFAAGSTTSLGIGPVDAPPKPPPPKPVPPSTGRRTGAIVALSLGGAFAIAGGVLGGLALKSKSELDGLCMPKDQCPATAQGKIDGLSTLATLSTVGFGAAIAGVGAGVVLIATSGDGGAAKAQGASITPWIGPNGAGIRGTF
ncbi:PEGA domain protein [Minicystis rosea]|nr:PEGA domain protein [Minicystis rosea]